VLCLIAKVGLTLIVGLQATARDTPRRQRSSRQGHASPLLTALRLTTPDYAPFSPITMTVSLTHTPRVSSLVRVVVLSYAWHRYQHVGAGCVGGDVYVDVPRLGNFTNCVYLGDDAGSIDCGNSEFACWSSFDKDFQLNGRAGTLPYGGRNYIYECCT
jgi:hypothetical protein